MVVIIEAASWCDDMSYWEWIMDPKQKKTTASVLQRRRYNQSFPPPEARSTPGRVGNRRKMMFGLFLFFFFFLFISASKIDSSPSWSEEKKKKKRYAWNYCLVSRCKREVNPRCSSARFGASLVFRTTRPHPPPSALRKYLFYFCTFRQTHLPACLTFPLFLEEARSNTPRDGEDQGATLRLEGE